MAKLVEWWFLGHVPKATSPRLLFKGVEMKDPTKHILSLIVEFARIVVLVLEIVSHWTRRPPSC